MKPPSFLLPVPGRVALFLAPLLLAYGLAVIAASGVPLADYRLVAGLFCWAAATLAAVIYVAGQGAALLWRRERLFRADTLVWLALGACCLVALLPSFGVFKQLILPQRGFTDDPALAAAGRFVLGGMSPWRVAHALFGSLWSAVLLDRLYTFWSLLLMAFPMLVPFIHRDDRVRAQMMIAWALGWLLVGTVAAWLFPSAGPCFYNQLVGTDADFAELSARLHALASRAEAAGMDLANVDFQSALLTAHHGGRYAPAGGISAMPSMHVATATLVALAGGTASRALGRVLAAYGVLIWIASVYFGWHYAVDGPVAVILMLAVWRLSGWIADAVCRTARESPAGTPVPCTA